MRRSDWATPGRQRGELADLLRTVTPAAAPAVAAPAHGRPQLADLLRSVAPSSAAAPAHGAAPFLSAAHSAAAGASAIAAQNGASAAAHTASRLSRALPAGERRRVFIINTGGTANMRVSADGTLECAAGYLSQRIHQLEELQEPGMPTVDVKEYQPMIDSSYMEPSHYAMIAADIEQNYYDYDGFVVVMGTDTMAYASSALSFMLENLGKTVVFTGSQIPFSQPYSDCRRNLLVSIIMAANSDYPEVCIFFNDRLMRASRAAKVNAYGLDAFDTPNFPPLATLATGIAVNAGIALPQPRGRFRVHSELCTRVVVLRLVPGFHDGALLSLLGGEADALPLALVLEVYGSGGCAMKDGLLALARRATEKGILLVAATQCAKGAVLPSLYAASTYIKSLNIASAGDMTTEALVAKLGYLLSKLGANATGSPSAALTQQLRDMLPHAIRGEVSPSDVYSQKLLKLQFEMPPSRL